MKIGAGHVNQVEKAGSFFTGRYAPFDRVVEGLLGFEFFLGLIRVSRAYEGCWQCGEDTLRGVQRRSGANASLPQCVSTPCCGGGVGVRVHTFFHLPLPCKPLPSRSARCLQL